MGRKAQAGLFWAAERRESSVGQVVSKSSCTWALRAGSAQGTGPSALPGSTTPLGCFSHQPDALTCHTQRGKPAQAGRGGPPEALHTRHWPAVMTPRRVAQRAVDVVAPRRAADGVAPSIDGARTCAGATTRGAAGRFPRVRSGSRSLSSKVLCVLASRSPTPRTRRGKLSTQEVFLYQKFGLPKLSPSQIGRNGKAQGQKAKGTEFEPRRSQNFLLKPLRPRAFSSRQGGEY